MNGGIPLYLCPNCGTVFGRVQEKVKCIHCGSSKALVCEHRGFMDYKIISFEKTIEEAKKEYKKRVMFNPLMKFSLKTDNFINEMRQIYIPCTLYNIKVSGIISFVGVETDNKKYDIGYDTNSSYKLLMSSLTEIDNKIVTTINNYSFDNCILFDSSLIKDGIIIGNNNDNSEDILKKVEQHIINIIKQDINYSKKKVKDNNLKIEIISQDYFLLPVYYLPLNSKGNKNMFLMNGQTSKTYCHPAISLFNTVLFTIIVFVLSFLLALLLEYFL